MSRTVDATAHTPVRCGAARSGPAPVLAHAWPPPGVGRLRIEAPDNVVLRELNAALAH